MNKNKSKYLLVMSKEEHIELKNSADRLGLSIKGFILLATQSFMNAKKDTVSVNDNKI